MVHDPPAGRLPPENKRLISPPTSAVVRNEPAPHSSSTGSSVVTVRPLIKPSRLSEKEMSVAADSVFELDSVS